MEYYLQSAHLHTYDGFGSWIGMHQDTPLPFDIRIELASRTSRRQVFDEIYGRNLWNWGGGVASGAGSSFRAAAFAWCALERIVASFDICSIADAGVGDFRWMHRFLERHRSIRFFVGVDISMVVVATLRDVFASDVAKGRYDFRSTDLVCDGNPLF